MVPPRIPTRFHRASQYSGTACALFGFGYGTVTRCGVGFPASFSCLLRDHVRRPYNPAQSKLHGLASSHFASPLLWESRLISFPLGTEMFHFPRLAPSIEVLELLPVGCPIQRSTDQRIFSSSPRLIAAYHVFHRLQRQGIRPLLLLTCFSRKKPLIISLFNCQRTYCLSRQQPG